ncbi:MAG TPA: transposase [Flavisolibacter sp.]|nr:transposase [Flavisolibacter sp.]
MFGEIRNGIMGFSGPGNEAVRCLQKIPELHQNFELDEFIVMPNHVHCILTITQSKNEAFCSNEYRKLNAGSISSIINQYKGVVKKWCNNNGLEGFEWQGRFYDHVIRNDNEYWAIKNYIINNPANWQRDKFFP